MLLPEVIEIRFLRDMNITKIIDGNEQGAVHATVIAERDSLHFMKQEHQIPA
jgi:hypothetical protein